MTHVQTAPVLRHVRALAAAGEPASDRDLLRRFAESRDEAAFATLMRRHGPMVLGVCRRVLGDRHAAEDALQATFVVLARKAGRLRWQPSVASWLYEVARRLASKARAAAARRAAYENRAAARPPTDPPAEVSFREAQRVLDEELALLPDCYRAPLVLCYLEGQTRDEAARQLGWSLNTLRRRVDRGRGLLRVRLARRGLGASGVGLLLAGNAVALPSAAVPGLVRAAVGAATTLRVAAVPVSGKWAALLLLAAGTVAAAAALRPVAPPPEEMRASAAKAPAGAEGNVPAAAVEVAGRVLDPEGRPAAGARLYLIEPTPEGAPKERAVSGADGRFRFRVAPGELPALYGWDDPWWAISVLATAPGCGPGFATPGRAAAAADLTLRLARDDVPVRGRVIDLQGRPVAGVTVRVEELAAPKSGDDLAPFVAKLRSGNEGYPSEGELLHACRVPELAKLFPPVVTDADGRFVIAGLGRERLAGLRVDGPTVETVRFRVLTRPGGPVRVAGWKDFPGGGMLTYYGSAFDHPAAPCLPVAGVVRAADTGKPLAGVSVRSEKFFNNAVSGLDHVRTTTDAEGRFRLTGLPKGRGNVIKVVPADGQPYLMLTRELGDAPALGAVTADVSLPRGVLVSGRVLDKATGAPVPAQVEYFTFPDNPALAKAPGFATNSRLETKPDGSFRLVALPGRGLLAVAAHNRRYVVGLGADKIAGREPNGDFRTEPHVCETAGYHALVEINPAAGAGTLARDVRLDHGRSVRGQVVGPDGKPLAGARICGLRAYMYTTWEPGPAPDAEFTANALPPDKPRTLAALHEGHHLAGYHTVRPGEEGPVRLKLEPWGVLTGRVVTADGRPRPAAVLQFLFGDGPDDPIAGSHPTGRIVTDKAGRFRIEGLVPGLKYHLGVMDPAGGELRLAGTARGVAVRPGETKDVGDVRPEPAND